MRSNPFNSAKDKKPYVGAFLAEVSTGKPEPFSIVPARFLCHLFNLWVDHREAGESLKMNQQRFTYVTRLMGYTATRKTRNAITCINVSLLPEPAPPGEHVKDSLGVENMTPFIPPTLAELPASITNEIIAVRHTLEILARNGKLSAEMWGEDGKLSAGQYMSKPYKHPTVVTEEPNQEPNVEQIEADEIIADASNEYDA